MPTERNRQSLQDILDNAERISSHVGDRGFEQFRGNELCYDATERCLARVSEAASRIMRSWEPFEIDGVNWAKVHALGNVLRHAYDRVDPLVVWLLATDNVPELRARIERYLGAVEDRTTEGNEK